MVAFSNCIRFGFRLFSCKKKQFDLRNTELLVRWLIDCIYGVHFLIFPWFSPVCIALGFE